MIFLNKHLPLGLFTCPASQTFQVEIFSEMSISHHSVMWSNTQRVTLLTLHENVLMSLK